jgi:tetratricopeptide (TPR) repeat protein
MLVGARLYDEALRKLVPIIRREQNPLAPPRSAPGMIRFFATGSTEGLAEYLNSIPAAKRSAPEYLERLRTLALYKDDWSEADRISKENNLPWEDPVEEAALQIALGNREAAHRQMEELLKKLERQLATASSHAEPLKQRAMAAALLGKLDLAREYLELARKEVFSRHDAMDESGFDAVTAFVLLWTGDKDGALRALAAHLIQPGAFSGNVFVIRHSPLWHPLRGDLRFEALLNDPKNNAPLY